MINNCRAYYEDHSDYYEIVGEGVYWLQGESDTTEDPLKYTQCFMAMWERLKAAGMDYMAFLRVRRGTGENGADHEDLSYSASLSAQIQMINQNPEFYMATTLTENWVGTTDVEHTIDISNYYTLMETYGGASKHTDKYGNDAEYNDGKLTTTMKTLYGSNNKCHYGKFGYAIIGADAAYNMYHALNSEKAAIELTDTSGKGTDYKKVLESGGKVTIDISNMENNLSFRPSCGSIAGTLSYVIRSGERDITDREGLVESSGQLYGSINTDRLRDFNDVSIEVTYTTQEGKTYSAICKVVHDGQLIQKDYMWDFNGDLNARNVNGDILNSMMINALKGSYSLENGYLKAKNLQLELEKAIDLKFNKNWSIEWKYGALDGKNAGFLLCESSKNVIGNKGFYHVPSGRLMISEYVDSKGYRNYTSSEVEISDYDCLKITNQYDPETETATLSLWQNGNLVISDFQKKGSFNSDSDTMDMTSYPLIGEFQFRYMGNSGMDNWGVDCEIDYLKIMFGDEKEESTEIIPLRYDDHYDITGKTVEIIDAGTPTSYQVGYGVEENTVRDTRVVSLEGDAMVATGVGTATVKIDGELYEVTVEAAPISLLLLIGQSNMRGSEGNAKQSIICPDGMVYATYGDDRGADNTAMTATNAANFAPSALTGTYSTINVNGTTDCISGYPVISLTEDGDGKIGPDSGFAYEWVKQTGEKVWIVNAAHGGTSINLWQANGKEYKECKALFEACQETLQKEIAAGHYTLSHMGYFWCQGCSDSSQSAKWYVEKYLAMHQNLNRDLVFGDDTTFEFGGIIPILHGKNSYRAGIYADKNTKPHYESFEQLCFTGPRAAQYWMTNNPELPEIWNVCNIGEDWVWMPDGTNGVSTYFQEHYPNGTVDYVTQVPQKAAWYTPKTPAAVHDSIHYNQIGYNELGREAVRNALILLDEIEEPQVETEVEFLSWDGYHEVTEVTAATIGSSSTLVVPKVDPVWKSKDVVYELTEGLTWDYYDLLAENTQMSGTLNALEKSVEVVKAEPKAHFNDHLSEMPESVCRGKNLWNVLDHDREFYSTGTHWGTHSSGNVYSVTIPVNPGDKIFATAFGKAGENGHASANGIRVTFFGDYGVVKTSDPVQTYAEFTANGGYLIAPEGTVAVNVPMWSNSDQNELYILNRPHDTSSAICSICGGSSHTHSWSDWNVVNNPTIEGPGTETRSCSCGVSESREVDGVWQTLNLTEHMQVMPEKYCGNTNLWAELEHDPQYYVSGSYWGKHSSGKVYSITIPVKAGDQIYASSFGKGGTHGGTANGIRCTFFDTYGVVKTMAPAEVYAEFSTNGYLTAPAGAVAVNVPMWSNSNVWEVKILNRGHQYENGVCVACDRTIPVPEWEIGTIASATGIDKAGNSRLRTTGYTKLTDFEGVGIGEGYTMTNFVYDEDYKYLGTSSWLGGGVPFTTAELQEKYPSGVYFRVVFRANDQRNLTEADIMDSDVKFYFAGEEVPAPDFSFSVKDVGKIGVWQDGSIWDGKLFALNASGKGTVFDVKTGTKLGELNLDGKDILKPHANSVCFGSTYYNSDDKYPLLYVNIYNNYASEEDRMEGTCCVYRITENDGNFDTELVQLIRIGFTEDLTLWKSKENNGDVRPYGNFTIDTDNHKLYAFVMRDANKTTRFFAFDIPDLNDGIYNDTYGCNVVTLEADDIRKQFDSEYYNYLQGCCYSNGMILYMSDFGGEAPLYIVSLEQQKVCQVFCLGNAGLRAEPE
ncbi:MAG: hypothetical protein IJM99_04170, partial [Firmicutes bacterium]|nr:hypothetical protein [Bacillota bacterium]